MSEEINNIVVYKNKIKKEILDISKEDLEAYKIIEWQKVEHFAGIYKHYYGTHLSLDTWDYKVDATTLPILVEIRDILNYSALTHPITEEEVVIFNQKEQEKKLADLQAKKAEEKAKWDSLTPKEQKSQLRTKFVKKLFIGTMVVAVLGLSLLMFKAETTTYPYPKDGCPSRHYWDKKGTIFSWQGSCKPYHNLPGFGS